MKKLTQISNNDLMELNCLVGRIENLINNDFLHVAELLPARIIVELSKISVEIDSEFNNREL